VTLEPPVFVTVSDKVCLLPTCTLPKLRLLGLDPSAPAAIPIPDSGTVRVGFEAFEVTVTFPLAAPSDVGLNETLKLALCPAASVTGAVVPLKLKPVPLIPTCEIVTLDPPVLVTVSERVCFFPNCTLPKLRLLGFDPRAPAETPVPESAMLSVGFGPSEIIVTEPFDVPVVSGAKATVNVALWFAPSATGAAIPVS
jgi:hypothetical protein